MTDYTQNVFFTPKDALVTGDPAKKIRGSEMDAELSEISTAIASKENASNKGVASGYASLDSTTKVPAAQLPTATETALGIVELATTAEATTGTDTARAVTAAGVKAVVDALKASGGGILGDLTALVDPGADRLIFWDESSDAVVFLEVGSGLNLTGTTLTATGTTTTDAAALTTGVLADGRVQQSNVTQHQAALSIAGSQLTGSIADARLSANVALYNAATPNFSGDLQIGGLTVGYKWVPQSSQSANYTCVLCDSGKHILHPSGGGASDIFTIPANSSVAYPIGTVITFINRDSNTLSIAITTDTMYLANTTTTGTRTLAQNGIATAIKVGTTEWIISGSGLS